jgi:hypothetical protein
MPEMAKSRTHVVTMNTIAISEAIAVTLHKICTPFTFRLGEQIPRQVILRIPCSLTVAAK